MMNKTQDEKRELTLNQILMKQCMESELKGKETVFVDVQKSINIKSKEKRNF